MLRRLFLVGLLSGCSTFLGGSTDPEGTPVEAQVVVSAVEVGPLAIDESGPYMLSENAAVRIEPGTDAITTLASAGDATELEVNGTRIYWSQSDELGLYSVDKTDGSDPTIAFHYPNVTGRFFGISVTDVEASFYDPQTGLVFRGPIDSPQTAPFSAPGPASDTLIIDEMTAWGSPSGLTVNDAIETNLLASGFAPINRLAASGNQVFATTDTAVLHHIVGTTRFDPIAEGQANPGDIAAVGTVVVWLNRDDGTVCYTRPGSGDITVLTGLAPGDHSLVADSTGVYVSEQQAETVWRFPEPGAVLD